MSVSVAVNRVIDLAGKVRDYYDTELPKWHPNYPLVGPDEKEPPPPPEEKDLRDFLATLPDETIYQLILLMYLGRGDVRTDDLAGHYAKLKKQSLNRDWAIAQMMGKASLADYLTDGLDELTKSGIDVNHLTFTSANSGS